ncbi:inactive N-acetylated-alpha-linked acidic dipeptidase-like protein 2 isoform X2 [Lepisosteus oculatus]|uniref:inactive N-acetylated-alpha-linked acidic dipeptidase-like protein 2 isoform X2 n=1 Tax=Lepisosteus oculatus TaxID=7918 RepID=UPI00073FE708|nr:PREDICTED: inactive N-acetylated-alpha-linked acidic dipeptidase-like protein 2 isoform X2 [Lepisosteus oculatus]
MGEKEGFYTNPALPAKNMAYRKVTAGHGGALHSQDLDGEALQATVLDLEWDMEKELEEPGFERFQLESTGQRPAGNSTAPTDLDMEPVQPSVSPQGRFERLQEDPDYVSHFTRPAPKSSRRTCWKAAKYFVVGSGLFFIGLLIGRYTRQTGRSGLTPNNRTLPAPPAGPGDLHRVILQDISVEGIKARLRDFKQLSEEEEMSQVKLLLQQWTTLGLTDVHVTNYTVLLGLPGSSPNTITDKASSRCFLPNGKSCDPKSYNPQSMEQLFTYAAYSANGTLEAAVVDVRYGTVDDLIQARISDNVTNKIALLKLGHAPFLYKLSLLAEAGFGGVLPYVDPCDLPNERQVLDEAFGITLNPGGDPSTPGYPSIDGSYREKLSNLTRLLVQPISASLARELLSAPGTASAVRDKCTPLTMPATAARKIIILHIGTQTAYQTVHNVIGYLKGGINPDRYVLVGSRHRSWAGVSAAGADSGSAIITEVVASLTAQIRQGWQPDRTTVFCSWGGSAFGNIGSFEWGEELRQVLLSNAVAYVSLHHPVRGKGPLHAIASPSLQQLAADITHKWPTFNCTRHGECSGSYVSSAQTQGDVDYFANHLGIPAVEFAYQETKAGEKPSFLSEALFPASSSVTETLDPSFSFHAMVAKLTGEAILRLVNEPVLPVNALDIALDVQNKLQDDELPTERLLALAGALRESAQLFQSDEMRPANDPRERDPLRVRMLNDVLQDLEKNFLASPAPPGCYRNILYTLDERTPRFSILMDAQDVLKLHRSNETALLSLSAISNAISSAERHLRAGIALFENDPKRKN